MPVGLYDPYHPVSNLIVYIYQMENFAYHELNRACRYKIESKINTLGPWAAALGETIRGAQTYRTDLDKFDHNK